MRNQEQLTSDRFGLGGDCQDGYHSSAVMKGQSRKKPPRRRRKGRRISRIKWRVAGRHRAWSQLWNGAKERELNPDSYLRMALSEQDNRLLTTEQGKVTLKA